MSVNPDVLRERTRGARAGLWRLAGPWWLFLLTAIAWLIIAWVALRFTPASIATVGVLLGVLFLFGMLDEFLIASVRSNWRWLHVAMGVIFAFGAGWSFARPYDASWTLASILGLLLIFRGTLDIITSVDARGINSAWWLGMVARHPGDPARLLGLPAVPVGKWGAAPGDVIALPDARDAGLVNQVRLGQGGFIVTVVSVDDDRPGAERLVTLAAGIRLRKTSA